MKTKTVEKMGAAYVPLTFPTITVQQNAQAAGVALSIAEVDRLWVAYQTAMTSGGLKPYNPADHATFLPLLQALETATDFTRLKVVAWLNGLYKAVNEQGWGWMWLDPKAAAATGNPFVDPLGALKQWTGDLGTAAGNFLTPVADPVTNLLKWGAILVVGGAVIYGVYEGQKYFKNKKRKKG